MRIYNIHTITKTYRYVGWKVPLLIESEEIDRTRVIVSAGDIDIVAGEYHSNETDQYDGSDPANWDKLMTNITDSTTISYDEYEDVTIDINPSSLYNMYDPLSVINNPQTAGEVDANKIIINALESIRPYIGRKICVGKHGLYSYFLKPEVAGSDIRMNCFLSVSIG